MKWVLALVVLWLGSSMPAVEPTSFRLLKIGNTENAELLEPQKQSIVMKMLSAKEKNYIVACSDLQEVVTAQKKLMFRVCGAPNYGSGAHLTVSICYSLNQSSRWLSANSPALKLVNQEFRSYTLGLDTDFRLADGVYTIRQIKFVLNGGTLPVGTAIDVKISDIRLGDASETGGGASLIVVPPERRVAVRSEARKIFFELENDDRSASLHGQRINHWVQTQEPLLPAGFSQLILENTDGIFQEAATPEEADVIVYARITPGQREDVIRRLAVSGTCVIAAGIIPDAGLEKLSGSKIEPAKSTGLPLRGKLHVASTVPDTLRDAQWSDAAFSQMYAAALRPGAQTLLHWDDGTPILTKRGNFYHFTTSLGATLEKSGIFFDKLLLRLAAGTPKILDQLFEREKQLQQDRRSQARRIVEKAAAAAGKSPDGFSCGASEHNFGRFGWRIGVTLGTGTLNNDLSFSAGDQSFRFSTSGEEALTLDDWKLNAVDSAVKLPETIDVLCKWSGVGSVDYLAEVVIPEHWRGREIAWEVRDGIDDVDDFFFNGEPAGHTGEETPNHWMTPRRYVLNTEKIRFGQPNSLRLRVGNLRGEAGVMSLPRLSCRKFGSRPVVSVSEIDWTGRVFRVKEDESSYRLRHSLLSHFLQYRFNNQELFLSQENIAEKAAWVDANGNVRVCSLTREGEAVYERERDGQWGAPWLLLFRNAPGRPLLCVFNRTPRRLEPVLRGTWLTGLRIVMPEGEESVICAGFPFGAASGSWPLSGKTIEKLNFQASCALNYPVKCREIFCVDREKKRIDVIDHFEFEFVENEWRISPRRYATLPPLSAFLLGKNKLISSETQWSDFELPTLFGPTLGVRDQDAVSYFLELPEKSDLQLVNVTDPKLNDLQNQFFADGLRWSCGGGTTAESWSAARPNGSFGGQNIDLFAWNFGLNSAVQGIAFLTPENRAGLEQRLRRRFLEPVECYAYKAVARHRVEPFSGLTYPVLFNSYHKLQTPFVPGTASGVVYADANEAHTVVMWLTSQLEDLTGQTGLAAANWNLLRYLARYQLCIEDYAFQSGSCRDTGVGAWIDMLNCEYAGMMAYARNAELAGDRAEVDQALYRAARRAVPTIARLHFREYLVSIDPAMREGNYQITGFGEDGAKYMRFPSDNHNFLSAMDLFDFSEGLPGTLVQLYRKYAVTQLQEHLQRRAWPSLQGTEHRSYAYLPALAFFAKEQQMDSVSAYAFETFQRNRRMGDWPGMRRPFEIGAVLWRANGRIALRDFRRLKVHKAVFSPEKRVLSLHYTADSGAMLSVEGDYPVTRVEENGSAIAANQREDLLILPATPGEHFIEVHYQK